MPLPTASLLPIVAALALAPTVNAWTFVWRNADGDASIEWGNGSQDCKAIEHAGGEEFSWDPKDSGKCILMYGESDCSDSVGGRSCPIWVKDASKDILAYQVVDADYTVSDSQSMTTTTSAVSTTTAVTTTAAEQTASQSTAESTSEPTGAPAPPVGSAISGGAIAGIVIGVIGGIILGVLIAWIMFRRYQRNSSRPASLGPSSFAGATPAVKVSSIPPKSAGGGSQPHPESPHTAKWGAPSSPFSPTDYEPGPEPYTPRPPPGTHLVELSDTHQLVELDGTSRP